MGQFNVSQQRSASRIIRLEANQWVCRPGSVPPSVHRPRRVREGQGNVDLRPAPLPCVTIQGLLINERVKDGLVPLATSTLVPAMENRIKILYEIAQRVP